MEFKNEQVIYSSKKCEITKGECNGKQCVKKTGNFSREAVNAIAQINSTYIPRIYEIGEDYIVSEYTEGVDLSNTKTPSQKVLEIALELCDALEILHQNSIIHRDIKPSNIILCGNGHIKLIDFDAARIKKTTADKDTVFIGTDGFAPPEQFGFAQTDERSDIYAFGITVKLLLGENYARSSYKGVIEKCIRFNPEQRYKSVNAVKSALVRSKSLRFALSGAASLVIVAAVSVIVVLSYSSKSPSDNIISVSDNSTQHQDLSISKPISSANTSNSTEYFTKDRKMTWDMLALPDHFPKLADTVTNYSVSVIEYAKDNKFGKIQYIILWQKMNDAEFDEIKEKLKSWLGVTDDGFFFEDDMIQEYAFATDRYEVSIQKIYVQSLFPHILGNSDDFFQGYICIEERGDDLKLPSCSCAFADPSEKEQGSRPIRWEDTVLNGIMPKLSDNVTEVKTSANGEYTIIWNEISIGELGCILRKITDWLGTSQCSQDLIHERQMFWSFFSDEDAKSVTVDYELDSIPIFDEPRLRVSISMQ